MERLPGAIQKRVIVEEVSDDEDDLGTFAFLEKGKAKRQKLKEVERLKNVKQIEERERFQAEEEARRATVEESETPTQATSHTRRGRRRGGGPSGVSVLSPGCSDAVDVDAADIDEEEATHRAKLRQEEEELRKLKESFNDDADDDADQEVIDVGAGSSGGGGLAAKNVWLKVHCDTGDETYISCGRDAPLEVELVPKVAERLGFLTDRMELVVNGQPLELSSSARALGLLDDQVIVARERALKKLNFKLVGSGVPSCTVGVAEQAPLSKLVEALCEHVKRTSGRKLRPAQVSLEFDGGLLDLSRTAAQLDLEDEDQLTVLVA